MITIGVNNGQNVELIQENPDREIVYILRDGKENIIQQYIIQPQEIISLLNDYIYKVETDHKREPTGLKDKTGKEICEGDIIQSSYQIHKVIYSSNQMGIPFVTEIISDRYKGNVFPLSSQLGYKKDGYYHADHIMVIGNIYE